MVRISLALALVLLVVVSLLAAGSSSARAAASPCSAARALQKLKRLDAAEAAYLEALKTEAGVECAAKGLQRLAGTLEAPRAGSCSKAKALAEAGQKSKAEEAYVKALEAKPGSKCATTGLKSLESQFWERVTTAGKNAALALALLASGLGAVALALTIALLIVYIVLQPLTRWERTQNRRPARWFVTPSLEINEFDDGWMGTKIGPQFASLVRANAVTDGSLGIRLATGHSGIGERLKPLGEVSEAKSAMSILQMLEAFLPSREFAVGGALQPKGITIQCVSVELTNAKRNAGVTSIDASEFDADPADETRLFEELAVPTAAWVDHQIAMKTGLRKALLTQDPQSWALFKAAAACQKRGDNAKARRLNQAALDLDPDNSGARGNLGVVELADGNYAKAKPPLEEAIAALEEFKGVKRRENADWYRFKLNLATLYAQWGAEEEDGALEAHAAAHAQELGVAAMRVLERPLKTPPALLKMLGEAILPTTLALYAGTAKGRVKPDEDRKPLPPGRVLARFEVGRLTPQEAIDYVVADDHLDPRVDYNIACAQAQQRDFAGAAIRLRDAIERAPPALEVNLAKSALADPSLAAMRTDWSGYRELQTALQKWSTDPGVTT